ncbi:protein of unknown function [Nitrosomonas aestuarii]|uniref:DUF4112 domain-containing protein n=1 Tax=Nitrosomonas aestuarii TaxID=52441 RepID=A0A1I3XF24_9PROT|nr:DUF4112 domain-containing protein [Nitrosomonas aestuarii]SFK17666.1 protein of unknown function [Nitrosomonas aestuarii]
MHKMNAEHSKAQLKKLAWLLDDSIRIPGTQLRFGLDGLIGLIPGIGDAAGAIISSHILVQAAQMGVPKSLLLKMAFNIGLDAVLGAVPVLGDLTDFVWKANQRNVQLMNDYFDRPGKTELHSRFFVGFAGLVVFGVVVLIGMLGFLLVRWLWLSVQGG